MSNTTDGDVFTQTLQNLHSDFQANPFEYGNEDMILPELYHRLKLELDQTRLPAKFGVEYGDDSWKVQKASESTEAGEVTRTRTETAFIHDSDSWIPSNRSMTFKFDLTIFSESESLLLQSKRTGPSNYFDSGNEISVLAEVKHSKNLSGNDFYSQEKGISDIVALSEFPGEVHERTFLFFDWWPEYQDGTERFSKYKSKLLAQLPTLSSPVTIRYLPRIGDEQTFTIS
ncbi:hypothetical protein G6M89_20710 [Natronolimnobius sp. AArcel1]|uniref:hypothetical protein n=1 Tax=Natronolimnobius sp. AArcel1 TaxID=1679093 RepID=UPI0013ECF80F|nr:hypothetical protein [Natronolimnobius sp. AArcel1]NGM71384.1 hypothetical protein [Natronolimnobius sp. AArcel1]